MRRQFVVWTGALLALTGCSAEAESTPVARAAESLGVLHIERVLDRADGRTALSAAFARYRDIESDSVLDLLGTPLPSTNEAGCTTAALSDAELAGSDATVELLDVGTLRVMVAGTEARLSPRAFPDLASVLAGVVYAGDAALAAPRGDLDEYLFHAEGSAEIPAFEAIVLAPYEPTEIRVGSAEVEASRTVSIDRRSDLSLGWRGLDVGDRIEIEVRTPSRAVSCVSADDGTFTVPASLLPEGSNGSVTLRRVRISPVDVPGVDDAYARVAVSREIPIELR